MPEGCLEGRPGYSAKGFCEPNVFRKISKEQILGQMFACSVLQSNADVLWPFALYPNDFNSTGWGVGYDNGNSLIFRQVLA